MRLYKTEQNGDVVEDILCNKCEKSLKIGNGEISNYEGLREAEIYWGYGSKNDLNMHIFSLCEDCVLELEAGFKIPPDVMEYHPWTGRPTGKP